MAMREVAGAHNTVSETKEMQANRASAVANKTQCRHVVRLFLPKQNSRDVMENKANTTGSSKFIASLLSILIVTHTHLWSPCKTDLFIIILL